MNDRADTGSVRIASFDVFDTCLARQVIAPSEVFGLVARAAHGARPPTMAEEAEFVATRIEAERRARRNSPEEEITLDAIWRELRALLPAPLLAAADPQLELTAEASVLGPVQAIATLVGDRRRQGCRIVFISDTYLPADFIQGQLRQHGFWREGDGLYVSSAERRTKQTGRLFSIMLARESTPPATIIHVGDHPISDAEVPRGLGIRIQPFCDATLQRIERLLLENRPLGRGPDADLAGMLHYRRLAAPPTGAAPDVASLVDGFLGPFTCAFGQWVLARARAHGLRRLYFAARDTQLLHAVCRRLDADSLQPVDCRYAYVSRQALLLAASSGATRTELAWVRRDYEPARLALLAGKLELAIGDLAPLQPRLSPDALARHTLRTAEDWEQFWALVGGPLAARIEARIARRREAALLYLRTLDEPSPLPAGLVDLGWFLTCQKALNVLLRAAGRREPLRGYYLELKQGRCPAAEAGPAEAVFLEPASDLPSPRSLHALHYRETLLEHIVGIADHPSVAGYEADGRPAFAAPPAVRPVHSRLGEIRPALEAYADRHGQAWAALADDDAGMRRVLAAMIEDFFNRAEPASVGLLRDLPCSSAQTDPASDVLVSPLKLRDVSAALLPPFLRPPEPSPAPLWPEAARLVSPPLVRRLSRLAPSAASFYHRLGWR